MINKIKNISYGYEKFLFIYLSIYLIFQIIFITKGGTTWDDLKLLETTPQIIHKFNLFFIDSSNPYLSEFVSNFEFYGYLVLIPAYLFSNNIFVINFFSYLLNDLFLINIINQRDFEYILRYIFLNIYVVISLFIIFKIYSRLSDPIRSFQFIVILTLVPAFSGHALFNLKDIPFMIQNIFVTLFFINYLINFKNSEVSDQIKLGVSLGLLLLIRFNGIAFAAIYFLFSFLYLEKNYFTIKKNIINWLKIIIISNFILLFGTPSSWQKPKLWIEKTIETQFNLYWDSYVLTNGKFMFAMDIEPLYLFTWFNYKLPIFFHFFVLFSFALVIKAFIKRNYNFSLLFIFSSYFISFIFLSFMILRPVAYDGIRQYLFLIPFFVFLVVESIRYLNKSITVPIFGFLLFYLIFTQLGLGPYRYVYFNEFAKADSITIDCDKVGGCGNWQTDYWGYSGKELITDINKELKGSLYLCSPKHSFSTYLDSENINIIDDLTKIDGEFYVAYFHRPMLINDTCDFSKNNLNVICENVTTKKVKLRFEEINLSYVSKCIKS